MHAGILTFTNVDDIDGAVRFLSDKALPILRAQRGYRGVTASADRSSGLFANLSLWDTEADRDASETALAPTREEARHLVSPHLILENYEVTTEELVTAPAVGLALMVTPISIDPAAVDDEIAFFQSQVVPGTRQADGFCGLRQCINRRTGNGLVGSAWRDEHAMHTYWANCHRAEGRPVTLGEPSFRELVFVDIN